MAHLLRVVLLLACLLGINAARAAVPPIYEGCAVSKPANVPADGSMVAGCGAYGPAEAPLSISVDPASPAQCRAGPTCNTVGFVSTYTWSRGLICPQTSTSVSGACVCNADTDQVGDACLPKCGANETRVDGVCRYNNPCPVGQHEEGGACVPNNCEPDEVRVNGVCVKEPPCEPGYTRVNGQCKKNGCEPGKVVGDRITDGENTTYSCEGGCTVRANPSTCVVIGGSITCVGTGRQTGSTCTVGEGPNGPGGNPGNGGDGDGGNDGGGSGGNPGEGGDGGGDGGGSGGGSGGNPGTPGTLPPAEPKPPEEDGTCPAGYYRSGKFCIKNPTPPDGDGVCPPGSVRVGSSCVFTQPPGGGGGGEGDGEGDGDKPGFGGSCAAGFACEGDAIQCAIAREQHRRACKLFDDESPESKVYNENKGKEGNQTGNLPGNETISITGRINTSDAIGGGGCFGDLNLTVWHASVSLPLSRLCQYLAMLGNILVAVSMLMAARIITRG